jgi:hypothetical protein
MIRVESFEMDGWEEPETGIIVNENDQWVLTTHIFDYIIDGYKLYNKKHITDRFHTNEEERVEKVLQLKNFKPQSPEEFSFSNTLETLQQLQNRYGIFEFQEDDQTELYYGRINKADGKNLIIDFIRSDGSIDDDFDVEFDLDEIRSISFESSYFEAIRLLWLDENR